MERLIIFLSFILLKSHLEISGKDNNDEHPLKIVFIFTFFRFYLGNDFNERNS